MQPTSGRGSGSKTRPPCPCLRRPTSWPRLTERELEMDAETLLPRLFPQGHAVVFDGEFFAGPARCGATNLTVIGARNKAPIGVELAHRMAAGVLETVREHPGRPIVLLVDTSGQRLSRRDELLGVNGYMAHLAKCLELARRSGHRTLDLVYEAVSGGFLATSLLADVCY